MTALEYVQTLTAGFLAALFALSGSQKLSSPFPAALAMVRFGLVRRIKGLYGRLAGVVELAVVLALVGAPTKWWSFTAATILGSLFVIIVSRALARGAEFPCGCFGEKNEQVSVRTLVRASFVFVLATCGVVMTVTESSSVTLLTGLLGVASGVLLACMASALLSLQRTRPFAMRTRVAEAA